MKLATACAAEPIAPELIADVERTFLNCHTLGDLLSWAGRRSPRVQVAEIVTQDEYTHDVVVPFASIYLSFDTT